MTEHPGQENDSLLLASDLISVKGSAELFEIVRTRPLGLAKATRWGILEIDPETGGVKHTHDSEGTGGEPLPGPVTALAQGLIGLEKPWRIAHLDGRAYGACACPPRADASEVLFALFDEPLADERRRELEVELVALARILGAALEKLRNEALLEALVESGSRFLTVRSREEAYEILKRQIQEKLGVSKFYLSLYNRAKEAIRCEFYLDHGRELSNVPVLKLGEVKENESYTVWVLKHNTELNIPDARNRTDLKPYQVGETKTLSYFAVPLRRTDGSAFGVLSIQGAVPRIFPKYLQQAVHALATLVAPTLSRLHRANLQAALLERMTEGNPQSVLQESLRSLWEVAHADLVTFYPYDARSRTFLLSRVQTSPGSAPLPALDEEMPALRHILEKGERFAQDAAADEVFGRCWQERYGTRAIAGVRLQPSGSNRPAGVVVVHYKEPRFNREKRVDIKNFSQFVAMATHLLELQDRRGLSERQRGAIEKVSNVAQREDLDETLEKAIRHTWPDYEVHVRLVPAARGPSGLQLDGSTLLPDTKSALALSVKLGDSLLGVLKAESPVAGFFEPEDRGFLEQIAKAVAPTLVAASRKERVDQVLEVAEKVANNPEDGFKIVTRSAHELATSANGAPTSTTLFLLTGDVLKLVYAWPEHLFDALDQEVGALPLYAPPGEKQGIVALAARGDTKYIDNIDNSPDYIRFDPKTRAELAVPVRAADKKVIGVLNLEYSNSKALDKEDQRLVENLAEQVKVAAVLQQKLSDLRSEQQRKLAEEQKKEAIAAALAFAGLHATDHAHQLVNLDSQLEAIKDQSRDLREVWRILREEMDPNLSRDLVLRLERTVSNLEEMSHDILDELKREPEDEGDAELKEFIRAACLAEALKDQWQGKISITARIEEGSTYGLMANRHWLNRGIFNLFQNSERALLSHGTEEPAITLTVKRSEEKVLIEVEDNGPGIDDPEIRDRLFVSRIPGRRPKHGLGCLLTSFIVHFYDGRVLPVETGESGTRITLEFPLSTEPS